MKDMMLEPNLKKCAARMIREEFAAKKTDIWLRLARRLAV